MSNTNSASNRFAVLIGNNFYKDKPLHGCVRDIDLIQQYLESNAAPIQVRRLTANTPVDTNSLQPNGEPESWPTFENVVSCLKQVTLLSRAGDYVHIHYSGHGTRKRASSSYSNTSTGDLALVLLDGANVAKTRYLPGLELAQIVHTMVENGVNVTLILDCCFSGSVFRHDDRIGVRYLDYDPAVDATYPTSIAESQTTTLDSSSSRDASMLPNWLINPDGYTILTACGPHEVAEELIIDGGERQGALSYFLLQALGKLGNLSISHQSIYHHLCSRFQASWPRQNPMFFGNRDLSFFGHPGASSHVAFVPVFHTDDGSLRLRAGRAHGVSEDDEYALCPLNAQEDISGTHQGGYVKARVSRALAVTSELELDKTTVNPQRVGTGWKARRLSSLSLPKIPIMLTDTVDNPNLWLQATNPSHSFQLFPRGADTLPFLFKLDVNERREYEILNEYHGKICGLPTVPLDESGQAMNQVMTILDHLARFKQIEAIENTLSDGSCDKLVDIQLSTSSGETPDKGFLEVKHGEELLLVVQNKGDRPLYLHIYDLKPSWQIQNILRGEYQTLLPKNPKGLFSGVDKKKLKMTVPEFLTNRGQLWSEDVIKIFITLTPTSFAGMVLDELPTSLRKEEPHPGGKPRILPAQAKTRDGEGGNEGPNDWTTRNFRVRTVKDRTQRGE
jgi:hypothetical protein